jgi:hypothetical protein
MLVTDERPCREIAVFGGNGTRIACVCDRILGIHAPRDMVFDGIHQGFALVEAQVRIKLVVRSLKGLDNPGRERYGR